MKKYLITYNENKVVTVSEAPESGVTASGSLYMIETLDFAKTMLQARGVDTSKIDEYKPVSDEFTQ